MPKICKVQSTCKKKNTESMSSPFKPNLTEAFSQHLHRDSNTELPVSDRLYQDAVRRTRKHAAGIEDAHCQHELDRERALLAAKRVQRKVGATKITAKIMSTSRRSIPSRPICVPRPTICGGWTRPCRLMADPSRMVSEIEVEVEESNMQNPIYLLSQHNYN